MIKKLDIDSRLKNSNKPECFSVDRIMNAIVSALAASDREIVQRACASKLYVQLHGNSLRKETVR